MQPKLSLVYIIGTFPSLTTTFIDREITSMRRSGVAVRVLSIRRPVGRLSTAQEGLRQGVIYLLPAAVGPLLFAHARAALAQPRDYFGTMLYLVTRGHPNPKSRLKTLLHFAEGVYAADRLRRLPCDQIHAHFVDRAATLAMVVSRLLKVPYSVTAHASDIYVNPVLLPEKLAGARFAATCTRYNWAHLTSIEGVGDPNRVKCLYHGLPLDDYQPRPRTARARPLVLSVGQLKDRKGFVYLLEACRILKDRRLEFDCEIIGDGPRRQSLEERVRDLDLEGTVSLRGSLPHQAVIERYAEADIFVQPSVVDPEGDRDGIPNVILEAMAMGLPVVSTRVSGIPEVVKDGVTGLLAPGGDSFALAEAISTLLGDAEARHRLGASGRTAVVANFDAERNVQRLIDEFVDSARPRADQSLDAVAAR